MKSVKQIKHQHLTKLIYILDRGFVSDLLSNVFDMLFSLIQAEDAERREKNLEEAKKIVIEEDKSLPAPKQVLCWDSLGNKGKFEIKSVKNWFQITVLLVGVVNHDLL